MTLTRVRIVGVAGKQTGVEANFESSERGNVRLEGHDEIRVRGPRALRPAFCGC